MTEKLSQRQNSVACMSPEAQSERHSNSHSNSNINNERLDREHKEPNSRASSRMNGEDSSRSTPTLDLLDSKSGARHQWPETPCLRSEQATPAEEMDSFFDGLSINDVSRRRWQQFDSLDNSMSDAFHAFKGSHDMETMTLDVARQKGLQLSGRIISALTCLPKEVVHHATEPSSSSSSSSTAKNENGNSEQFSLRPRHGSSALFSALATLDDSQWDLHVVGWIGEIKKRRVDPSTEDLCDEDWELTPELQKAITQRYNEDAPKRTTVPVWLPTTKNASCWRNYPEHVIWPIMHYILDETFTLGTDPIKEWWDDYVAFNEAYCDKILEIYETGDVVWIHDHYLFLLPHMIRMRRPDAFIGTFIHAPFPSSEYFRCIPQRATLLESILGSNIVGLQAHSYARHFLSSCTRLLGVEASDTHINAFGMYVAVATLPIGINAQEVERAAFDAQVDKKVAAIRKIYPDKKIIVGRDRLDSIRGLVQKLRAMDKFFEKHPDYADKVVLIQVTSPATSYHGTPDDVKIEQKVSELTSKINSTYGTISFVPIHHYARHIARDEYLALLRVADVALVTSVRDGMNTTLLEYVVCQKNTCRPVIVSEFTGIAAGTKEFISVNPWDAGQVADALFDAIQDSPKTKVENEQREHVLYETVTSHTGEYWVSQFLSQLFVNILSHKSSHVTPLLDSRLLVQTYKTAKTRLFLFDYDGTLTPIVKEPSAALPSPQLYSILEALTSDPHNNVWIISGRDQDFLDKWLGSRFDNISFSAEHGCFVKRSHDYAKRFMSARASEDDGHWQNLLAETDMSWQPLVKDIFVSYTERTPGSSIEHKRAALTWHYRRADPSYGAFQARDLKDFIEKTIGCQYDIEVMTGKANIEVRPKKFNKGEIVKNIVHDLSTPQFVYCAGDDATDEDMFSALGTVLPGDPATFSITVGPPSKLTVASWHLLDSHQVLESLSALVAT